MFNVNPSEIGCTILRVECSQCRVKCFVFLPSKTENNANRQYVIGKKFLFVSINSTKQISNYSDSIRRSYILYKTQILIYIVKSL